MLNERYLKLSILLLLICAVLFLFFQDGYYQPINPDTFVESTSWNQDLRFPEMLVQHNRMHHSRWFAEALPYLSFNIISQFYSAITGDSPNSLFVAQGFLNGVCYLFFILISACYLSMGSPIISWAYIFSFLLIFSVATAGGLTIHYYPFIFRFYHEAITGDYIWTFSLLLLVFLPYWNYYLHNKWIDNLHLKAIWWIGIVFCAFSHSCSTIIALFLSACGIAMVWLLNFRDERLKNEGSIVKSFINSFPCGKDQFSFELYILFILCSIAMISESFGGYAQEAHSLFTGGLTIYKLRRYLYIWREFVFHGRYLKALSASGVIFILVMLDYKFQRKNIHKNIALKMLTAALIFVTTSLIYSLIIGTEEIPYRYRGTNLGGDTIFYYTWSLTFTIIGGTVLLLRHIKIKFFIPLAIMVAISHVLPFFSFKPLYADRQKELHGFQLIQELDRRSPPFADILLPEKYSDVLNMWQNTLWRTAYFACSFKLTTTLRTIKFVPEDEFEKYYASLPKAIP